MELDDSCGTGSADQIALVGDNRKHLFRKRFSSSLQKGIVICCKNVTPRQP